jgi:acyl-homoserine lactone acylase PvdQ
MVELQGDTLSVEARRLMPFVLAARDADPTAVSTLGLGPALDRLASWDFTTPSGVAAAYRTDGGPDASEVEASIAAAIFFAFAPRFYAAAFDDEKTQYAVGFNSTTAALYLLENPTTSQTGLTLFDDPTTTTDVETPNDLILRSLRDGLDFLEVTFGSDMNSWRWGELHQVEVQDLFGEFGVSFRTLGADAFRGRGRTRRHRFGEQPAGRADRRSVEPTLRRSLADLAAQRNLPVLLQAGRRRRSHRGAHRARPEAVAFSGDGRASRASCQRSISSVPTSRSQG